MKFFKILIVTFSMPLLVNAAVKTTTAKPLPMSLTAKKTSQIQEILHQKFDFITTNNGTAFNQLPAEIRNSGKKVTLTMPNCKETNIVQIRYSTIEGVNGSTPAQVLTFDPKNMTQTVQFPEESTTQDFVQYVTMQIMPESRWKDFLKQMELFNIQGKETPEQLKEIRTLGQELAHSPHHTLQFKYESIKEGQTITIPYAAIGIKNIDQLTENFKKLEDGTKFKELSNAVKKSGKTVQISMPECATEMFVAISQSVQTEDGRDYVQQNIIITPSSQSVTVDIPKPATTKNPEMEHINIQIVPLKLHEKIKHLNSTIKEIKKMTPEQRKERQDILDMMRLFSTFKRYSYETLPTTLELPNPMEVLSDVLGCTCTAK